MIMTLERLGDEYLMLQAQRGAAAVQVGDILCAQTASLEQVGIHGPTAFKRQYWIEQQDAYDEFNEFVELWDPVLFENLQNGRTHMASRWPHWYAVRPLTTVHLAHPDTLGRIRIEARPKFHSYKPLSIIDFYAVGDAVKTRKLRPIQLGYPFGYTDGAEWHSDRGYNLAQGQYRQLQQFRGVLRELAEVADTLVNSDVLTHS